MLDLSTIDHSHKRQFTTDCEFFDTMVGGHLEIDTCVLLHGSPGNGKSTLTTQTALAMCKTRKVTVFTLEEGIDQWSSKLPRFTSQTKFDNLTLSRENDVYKIVKTMVENHQDLIVIDSLSKLTDPNSTAKAGSSSQIDSCVKILTDACKKLGTAAIFVGQANAKGVLFGQKSVEHEVDIVLKFEKLPTGQRKITSSKNRLAGEDGLVVVCDMTDSGLVACRRKMEFETGRGVAYAAARTKKGQVVVKKITCQVEEGLPKKGGKIICEGVSSSKIKRIRKISQNVNGFSDLYNIGLFVENSSQQVLQNKLDLATFAAMSSATYNCPDVSNMIFVADNVDMMGCCHYEKDEGLENELRQLYDAQIITGDKLTNVANLNSLLSEMKVSYEDNV